MPIKNKPADTLPPLIKPNPPLQDITFEKNYQIADLPIRVRADLPITEGTFHPKFKKFEIGTLTTPLIDLAHRFHHPDLSPAILGDRIYQAPPWEIYRRKDGWFYLGRTRGDKGPGFFQAALFSEDHARGEIFHPDPKIFQIGNLTSLSLFPTDQIFLARVLTEYQACYLHGAGMIFGDRGLLFAGHSEAGKSTITHLLREEGEILCDDRVIVRRHPEGFRVHGTWSHGDIPDVSSASALLKAILFLEQAPENKLVPLPDRKEVFRRLVFLVIRPLVTGDWWEKQLSLLERIIQEVPAYILKFRKDKGVREVLQEILDAG